MLVIKVQSWVILIISSGLPPFLWCFCLFCLTVKFPHSFQSATQPVSQSSLIWQLAIYELELMPIWLMCRKLTFANIVSMLFCFNAIVMTLLQFWWFSLLAVQQLTSRQVNIYIENNHYRWLQLSKNICLRFAVGFGWNIEPTSYVNCIGKYRTSIPELCGLPQRYNSYY